MSDNTPESAVTTSTGSEAAPAPARRRRATRSVAAPDAVSTPAPAAVEAPALEAAAEAPAKKPARKRAKPATDVAETPAGDAATEAPRAARSRVGRKAAAPVEASVVEAPVVEPSVTEPSVTVAETPAPTKTRKRATRPAAAADAVVPAAEPSAAAPTAPLAAAPTVAAPAEAAPVAAPESAAPARRRRASSRPAAAPGAPVEAAAPAAAEPVEDAPALDVLAAFAEPAAAAPAAAAPRTSRSARAPRNAPRSAPATEAAPPAAQPRLATTALLFQAPDPTASRQRRRRATSSAGSPEAISEAARIEREQEEQAELEAAQLEAARLESADGETETEDAPVVEERPAASGNRSSRRRGRRGRGGEPPRAADDEPAEETPAEDEADETDETRDVEGAPAAEVESETDENDEDEDDESGEAGGNAPRRRRRRGGRGRRRPDAGEATAGDATADDADGTPEGEPGSADPESTPNEDDDESDEDGEPGSSSRRRRRRRRGSARPGEPDAEPRPARTRPVSDEVTALRGSTRLEAKRQRRREGRDAGRRRQIITEAEFLARRESVDRSMIVREKAGRTQIAVLEDGVLVEHYVSNQASVSMVGNVYLGRVQNVLPSMEAAFVDVGKGRNAVLYAGEVNWDAANVEGGSARRIEQALKSGDSVLVQVTKDPIGHKGARLTSQVTLAGRYLVYVPGGGMTGISRKLPDIERNRLKKILREVVPDSAGVIVRTAAEGASEEELRADIARLQSQWDAIEKKSKTASAPALLQGEPDMAIRVVRDIFNDDFGSLVVQGDEAWSTISQYIDELAPDLAQKISKYTGTGDVFSAHRIDEQLAKGMDRKVWLPSGGSLVIDRTEAMTVVDVNTGKFTGSGGTLEETVTRNNLEAAEEIVRQLRLRDIGGMIVVDFIDMVLESNRDLVLRRLVECLGRDRTKHQVAEVTSLGLVQMTRKRVGQGLVEAFSETCEHCHGRGFIVHDEPIEKNGRSDAGAAQQVPAEPSAGAGEPKRARRKRGGAAVKEPAGGAPHSPVPVLPEAREAVKATLATIAAAAAHAHDHDHDHDVPVGDAIVVDDLVAVETFEELEVEAADEPVEAPEADEAPEAEAVADRPVLDVLAAFADHTPAPTSDATLELTPVDAVLFEVSEGGEADDDATDEQGDQPDGSPQH
ncbi:Rne/Rng family ribonuclease [Cellulomonas sp. PhB150]|uniref:Rne/Rng family ribonuclease n=1 Tax=Cellulomonas sp. PhB150 TaxID=2485188 RepID=UPI000F47C93C|nr:Rne/Rng family ribonuclease [Cellulomonas sp. PhB150]